MFSSYDTFIVRVKFTMIYSSKTARGGPSANGWCHKRFGTPGPYILGERHHIHQTSGNLAPPPPMVVPAHHRLEEGKWRYGASLQYTSKKITYHLHWTTCYILRETVPEPFGKRSLITDQQCTICTNVTSGTDREL